MTFKVEIINNKNSSSYTLQIMVHKLLVYLNPNTRELQLSEFWIFAVFYEIFQSRL